MPYRLVLAATAPLLVLQGQRVRRDILRLTEPEGARLGRTGHGQSLRLLVLGDSAAAGVGVTAQTDALTGQLIDQLKQDHQLHWECLATTGHTVQDILQSVQQRSRTPVDVVVISAGVNDVTALTPGPRWQRQYQALLAQLSDGLQARLILCTALPPMHAFPALPQPLRWVLGQRARHLNRILQQLVDCHPSARLLKPELPLQPEYVAADGFHPAAASYQLWAREAARLIRQPD